MERRNLLKLGILSFGALTFQGFSIEAQRTFNRNKINALLLSGLSYGDTGYFEYAKNWLVEFVRKNHLEGKKIAFVPYGVLSENFATYEKFIQQQLSFLNVKIQSIYQDPINSIYNADAIAVGEGNIFLLMRDLYENDLIRLMRDKIFSGTPYIGWGTGAAIASDTIKTAQDMPVVEVKTFNCLKILPCQIVPHFYSKTLNSRQDNKALESYLKGRFAYNIITRAPSLDMQNVKHSGFLDLEEKISEYLALNPKDKVYGLTEDSIIWVQGTKAKAFSAQSNEAVYGFKHQQETEIIKHEQEFIY